MCQIHGVIERMVTFGMGEDETVFVLIRKEH